MSTTRTIVVGTDGTHGSRAAIRYAAAEAARLDAVLKIVHVTPDYSAIAGVVPVFPLTASEAQAVGHKILAAAVAEARFAVDPERIATELVAGSRVASLVRASAHAELIVLGDQPATPMARLVTGAVLGGVAVRSQVPVVVVPGDWAGGPARGLVVVGVKSCDSSEGLVRRAFEIAADRKAHLRLVHAWELPTLYDEMIVSRLDQETWSAAAREALEKVVGSMAEDYPGVEVEISLAHGQPARILADASAEADLLLLARREHAFPLGYLGSTGRTLVRSRHCPVVILPPAAEPAGFAGLRLEEHGRAVKS